MKFLCGFLTLIGLVALNNGIDPEAQLDIAHKEMMMELSRASSRADSATSSMCLIKYTDNMAERTGVLKTALMGCYNTATEKNKTIDESASQSMAQCTAKGQKITGNFGSCDGLDTLDGLRCYHANGDANAQEMLDMNSLAKTQLDKAITEYSSVNKDKDSCDNMAMVIHDNSMMAVRREFDNCLQSAAPAPTPAPTEAPPPPEGRSANKYRRF